jgi:tRNA modification GTPase
MSSYADTIFALATPPGVSGVCVFRLSGSNVHEIVKRITGYLMVSRETVYLPFAQIDKGLLLTFIAPNSFTGEDVAEFQLHGSLAVIESMTQALLETKLCRIAQPGEFARRALMNGKLDLTQVESLKDVLEAQTASQLKQAQANLNGFLRGEIFSLSDDLLHCLALIEATIDFPDEDDVTDRPLQDAKARLKAIVAKIELYIKDSHRGQILRDGFVIALAGLPNAGKSSLLNYFAGSDVAIVSPIAGTTRDAMVVNCNLNGTLVRFVDMAGLRETQDPIEQEGIKRAKAWLEKASLILHLQDVNLKEKLILTSACETWSVVTKIDCVKQTTGEQFAISVKTKQGLAELEAAIQKLVSRETTGEPVLLTRERHVQTMQGVLKNLNTALELNFSSSSELVAEEVRKSLLELGSITGYRGVEEMLDRLFSGFCIGK